MKLRIKGNTLRLRLNQQELQQLAATGAVEDQTQFSPQQKLSYRIHASPTARTIGAAFNQNTLTVSIPSSDIQNWHTTDTVGLYSTQDIGPGEHLEITLEKDFTCLHPNAPDRDPHTFPNPAAALK
jgi:hypothetical protein